MPAAGEAFLGHPSSAERKTDLPPRFSWLLGYILYTLQLNPNAKKKKHQQTP
jgi:hypothetical protein